MKKSIRFSLFAFLSISLAFVFTDCSKAPVDERLNQSSNGFEDATFGGAPVIGIQFQINPRLSLSTEAAYNAFFVIKDTAGDTNLGALTSFNAPSFLYLNFDF